MRKVGLFEAKQRLSELVRQASEGERIGITRRGRLAAIIGPAQPEITLQEIFGDIEEIRKRVRLPRGATIEQLIRKDRD